MAAELETRICDVAIIGAGSAGLAAYKAARAHGKKVVLIEGGVYGTTCARVGCMPSKLLIAAADAAHMVGKAGAFGVQAGESTIDGRAVMTRVKTERDRFVSFVLESVERIPAEDRISGHARFMAPGQLKIDERLLIKANAIVIATGSSATRPRELAPAGDRLLISDDVFGWSDLPRSLAVVGTGIIGLELGQALHRLGVRVTFYGSKRALAQLKDKDVLASAIQVLGDELDLRLETEITGVQRHGDEITVNSRGKDGIAHEDRFDYVLAATGRTPNVGTLDLQHTGLALDDKGVPKSDPHTAQCGDSAIFIAGDASGERPLLHEAVDSGRIAGENAARFPAAEPGLRRVPLGIAFTDPQIATVGKTHGFAPGQVVVSGDVSFDDQGRSRVMLENQGLLRVFAETGSGCFLGAEMIGPRAENLAHLLAWACQSGMTIQKMLEMPFYHPVVEEGLRTALRNVQDKLLHGLPEIELCASCTPGV